MNLTQKLRNMVDEIEELSVDSIRAKENLEEDEATEIQELSDHLFFVQSFIRYCYLPILRDIFGEEDEKSPL